MLYSYLFIVYFSKYAIVLKELCFLIVINSVQTPLHEVHLYHEVKPLRQVPEINSLANSLPFSFPCHTDSANSFPVNNEGFI